MDLPLKMVTIGLLATIVAKIFKFVLFSDFLAALVFKGKYLI